VLQGSLAFLTCATHKSACMRHIAKSCNGDRICMASKMLSCSDLLGNSGCIAEETTSSRRFGLRQMPFPVGVASSIKHCSSKSGLRTEVLASTLADVLDGLFFTSCLRLSQSCRLSLATLLSAGSARAKAASNASWSALAFEAAICICCRLCSSMSIRAFSSFARLVSAASALAIACRSCSPEVMCSSLCSALSIRR